MFLSALNRPRGKNRGKTFAGVPNCMVVKVKDAKTTLKQSKCSAYDNTKKARLYLCSLQLLLQLLKCESRERSREKLRPSYKKIDSMLETTEKTGKKKHDKNEREDWRTVGELLINPLSFTQLAQSHRVSVFPAARSLSVICKFSVQKVPGAGYLNTNRTFFGVVVLVFLRVFQPVCATLALFHFVSASFTLTTMAVGNTSEGFALFFLLGRFERLKTVLMGTNTPHTFIPGLVWQKQARRFSQFELKVGELGFAIHFVKAEPHHQFHYVGHLGICPTEINVILFRWTCPASWIHESVKIQTNTSTDPERSRFWFIRLTTQLSS